MYIYRTAGVFSQTDVIRYIMKKQFILFFLTCLCCHLTKGQVEDSIKLKNATLYYSLYGNGKPILLLSGGPGASAFMLEPIANSLSNDYQCILFEQRGTGKSRTNPFDSTTINLKQAAEDIDILRKKLSISKLTILGHSWGAMLAMYYTINYPDAVEKLILVAPGGLGSGKTHATDNRTARATIEEREATRKAQDSINKNIATPETIIANRKRFLRLNIYDAYKADSLFPILAKGGSLNIKMSQLMMMDVTKHYDVREGFRKLKIPTLVICGIQDPLIFPVFEIMELNKNAIIQWIEKSGHYPFVEQPQAFYQAVTKFLR